MHRALLAVLFVLPLSCSSSPAASEPPPEFEVTIDSLVWSEDVLGSDQPGLLGHLSNWDAPPTLHQFTGQADKVFYLVSGEHQVTARTGTGGLTSPRRGRFIILHTGRGLLPDREYSLRARNESSAYRWRVADGVTISR